MIQTLFFLSCVVLLPATACFAARPLTVDDTDPIDPGAFQFDVGVENTVADPGNYSFPTNLAYGAARNLQVQIGTGVTIQNDDALGRARGLNDFALGAKWRFYDAAARRQDENAIHNFKIALGATLKLPTANRNNGPGTGTTDFGGIFLLTCECGATAFDFNGGYTLTGNAPDVLDYGVALRRTQGKLRPVGEIVGSTTRGAPTEFLCNAGVQYDVNSRLTLDAAVGHGLGSSDTGVFLTLGLTQNF